MDVCCWHRVESWCGPGGGLDRHTCSLEGPKRYVMRVGMPRRATEERAAGSRKQRKPEKETCKGEFAGTGSPGSSSASSSGLTVSARHHRGPCLFPRIFPPTRLSSTATVFVHSSSHTRLSVPDVPQHQPRRLPISTSLTLAPLLASGECSQLPTLWSNPKPCCPLSPLTPLPKSEHSITSCKSAYG